MRLIIDVSDGIAESAAKADNDVNAVPPAPAVVAEPSDDQNKPVGKPAGKGVRLIFKLLFGDFLTIVVVCVRSCLRSAEEGPR